MYSTFRCVPFDQVASYPVRICEVNIQQKVDVFRNLLEIFTFSMFSR